MKRKTGIILLTAMLLILVGCAGNRGSENGNKSPEPTTAVDVPTVSPTITGEPAPTQETKPTTYPQDTITPEPQNTPTPNPEDPNLITWAVYGVNKPDEAAQEKINKLLASKGYDLRIRFITMSCMTDDVYISWVNSYKYKLAAGDILSSGAWSSPQAANAFAETYFAPLNDFLATEKGQELRSLWSKGAWDRVTDGDGNVYAIPRINTKTSGSACFNGGIYITVPEEYREYFATFDGTYRSLCDIRAKLGDSNAVIEIDCGYTDRLLNAFLGYQDYAGIPYDPKTKKFVNLSESGELTGLLESLAKDLEQGTTVRKKYLSLFADAGQNEGEAGGATEQKVFAVIHDGIAEAEDGFFEVCMAEDPYYYNCALSYGISAASEKKEKAAFALWVCFTDPEIAALLTPDSEDFVRLEERLRVTEGESAGALAGFARYELAADCPAVSAFIDPADPVFGYERQATKVLDQLSDGDFTEHNWATSGNDPVRIDFCERIGRTGKAAQCSTTFETINECCEVNATSRVLWIDTVTGICGCKIEMEAEPRNDGKIMFSCLLSEFAENDTRMIIQLSGDHKVAMYADEAREAYVWIYSTNSPMLLRME